MLPVISPRDVHANPGRFSSIPQHQPSPLYLSIMVHLRMSMRKRPVVIGESSRAISLVLEATPLKFHDSL